MYRCQDATSHHADPAVRPRALVARGVHRDGEWRGRNPARQTAGPASPLAVSQRARAVAPGEAVLLTFKSPAGLAAVHGTAFGAPFAGYAGDSPDTWHALIGIDLSTPPGGSSRNRGPGGRRLAAPSGLPLTVVPRTFSTRRLSVARRSSPPLRRSRRGSNANVCMVARVLAGVSRGASGAAALRAPQTARRFHYSACGASSTDSAGRSTGAWTFAGRRARRCSHPLLAWWSSPKTLFLGDHVIRTTGSACSRCCATSPASTRAREPRGAGRHRWRDRRHGPRYRSASALDAADRSGEVDPLSVLSVFGLPR